MSRIQTIRTLISASIAALAMLPAFAHAGEVSAAAAPGATATLDYRMNEHVVQVPAGSDDVTLRWCVGLGRAAQGCSWGQAHARTVGAAPREPRPHIAPTHRAGGTSRPASSCCG